MTVLQQVRDYYTAMAQPSADATKKVMQRVMTPDGIKNHPTPQDYYAAHIQKQDDEAGPARLLSEQV